MNSPLYQDRDFDMFVLIHQARDATHKAREKELSQFGISTRECAAMHSIHVLGGNATPADISRRTYREHHTVTALLHRMEKRGLIVKAKDSNRKNMWRVSLTEKGENAYHQSIDKRESIYTAMSSLPENKRQQLETCLRQVRDKALKYLVTNR